MKLNKNYGLRIENTDDAVIFDNLLACSIRKDIPNTYIKIKKDCISIIYRDYTKFKYESLYVIEGSGGAYWVRRMRSDCKIHTHIGHFSRIDIHCNIRPIRGYTHNTIYTAYYSGDSPEQNFGNIQEIMQRGIRRISYVYSLSTEMRIMLSEIMLNIFQHNFVEGVDEIEYLENIKRRQHYTNK